MQNTLQIRYFTDPLCCWSWGFEPIWQQFRSDYPGCFSWSYCMGGMLKDWSEYYDPVNLVSRPIHMGALWLQAQYVTGQQMNHRIWVEDPPVSSFPASIAFKCIEKQSPKIAENFLLNLRQKMMLDGVNISRSSQIFKLVYEIAGHFRGKLDIDQFHSDYVFGCGRDLLQHDINTRHKFGVVHLPTLLFLANGSLIFKLEGYHTYPQLCEQIDNHLPGLKQGLYKSSQKSMVAAQKT